MACEHLVEDRHDRAVAASDEEREPGGVSAEVHEQVAGLPGGPCPGGAGGDAQDVHPAGADLYREEDVQPPEEHRVDVHKPRQDPGCLGGQELPPGR